MKRSSSFRAAAQGLAGVVLAILLLASSSAAAVEDWGYDLGSELMSPYCPGRTLSSCPSPQAAELVQWIVTQEAAGASKEQVIEMLIERFGEEILGAPPAEGITLWAYIFPVAGFLLFGVVAVIVLRRMVRPGGDRGTLGVPDEALAGAAPGVSSAGAKASSFPPETSTSVSISGAPSTPGADAEEDDFARRVDAEIARRH